MKIDHRKNYVIIFDTETANDIADNLFYDFGFIVMDTKGNIYEQYSLVNSDIFIQEQELMKSAYYAKKIPTYWREIWSGKRKVMTTYEIKNLIHQMVEKYRVKLMIAHNVAFDKRSGNKTQRYVTKSKYRYFFPKEVEFADTMRMAQEVICPMPSYKKFCIENNYLCKNGQVRKTAEILYRFISGNNEFAEVHMGLQDVMIEKEIYLYCKKKRRKK